ncbi:hypothetical protein COX85_03725 [Candidatus Micrarchaeota archaeon CG_4_10_14_0_2_um_filter_55_9]|nr:MAG: hypothetical protein AUJ15_00920 [Candidatus Micrarchaeota archaeon CG1_02_55_41]PIO02496.1 MAG: hypothetical protein COT57_03680 [Candidatus Micrarchaeota archaeon CG09_land_8_20_14_0_10_55_25]PIZ91493.1 MAG: hypothetical protein COX85_03725 [Candidatus Micrarchaeota archaeon CG_4_10_14_0_2_um_filter_55_9]PJD00978.1 MAG: hypothetical protein COU38_03545 [Candidatus Micrarchaeota archaeon CG10_big_fil_rev_8_21_14_0_10_54_18]
MPAPEEVCLQKARSDLREVTRQLGLKLICFTKEYFAEALETGKIAFGGRGLFHSVYLGRSNKSVIAVLHNGKRFFVFAPDFAPNHFYKKTMSQFVAALEDRGHSVSSIITKKGG